MTPAVLKTSRSLAEIRQHLIAMKYTGEGEGGWGSIHDATDGLVGQIVYQRPAGGNPEEVQIEPYPRLLNARLYWSEVDKQFMQVYGSSGDINKVSRFRAADVIFAEDSVDNQLVLLMGERNDSRLRKHLLPAVRNIFDTIDPTASITLEGNVMEFGDDDFFRWVLHKCTHDPKFNNDLEILVIRAMANQDVSYRPTMMSKGIDLDRPELLALLANSANRLGPAKMEIWSHPMQMQTSFEAAATGQFTIYRGGSFYDTDEELSEADLGIRLLLDTAFEVLPELRRLHNADSAWVSTNRAMAIAEARSLLGKYIAKLN